MKIEAIGEEKILVALSILSAGISVALTLYLPILFGDAIDLASVLPEAPKDALIMGNVSPSKQFCNGTPDTIAKETHRVMAACSAYPNFVISSGCDIPPLSSWENIDAFFAAVKSFQL